MPATRPIICLTERSRSGEPSGPRKYFWATMLVAFCDQVSGNSTSRCSKAGAAGSPMIASRSSQAISSKGWVPSVVNRRSIFRPPSATLAAVSIVVSETAFSISLSLKNAVKW